MFLHLQQNSWGALLRIQILGIPHSTKSESLGVRLRLRI